MRKDLLPATAAGFWGAAVFLPVGLNYLGLLLVLATVLASGDWQERWQRMRSHPMWWPALFLAGWQLLVLAIGPHYPESGQNMGHGIRIVLTVLLALALKPRECLWALRGVLGAAAASALYIGLTYAMQAAGWTVPVPGFLLSLISMQGNKSINNALVFTVIAAACAAWAMPGLAERRWARAAVLLVPFAVVLVIISTNLQSRTSLLALLVTLPALCLHLWRNRLSAIAAGVTVVVAAMAAVLFLAPDSVLKRTEQGLEEIASARAGDVSHGSWAVRYQMYEKTLQMIADRPVAGWGIGGWTSQWHARAPETLRDYNMPHNDYLWMGSQTGVPGLLGLLVLLVAGLVAAWRHRGPAGAAAFGAVLILLLAAAVNSALRDAQIGLSLLWAVLVVLRAAEAPSPWRDILGRHGVGDIQPARGTAAAPQRA